MEIILGIIGLFVWLGTILYMSILLGWVVLYMLNIIFKIMCLILGKFFKNFSIPKIDFSNYEKKLSINKIKFNKKIIKRAKNTKVYFFGGIVVLCVSLIFIFLFLIGTVYNEYLWSFLIFGTVCMVIGVSYLKIHRRFNEKRL